MSRSRWREIVFIGAALVSVAVWHWLWPDTPRWLPLLVVLVAGAGTMVVIRGRTKRLPVVPVKDFVDGCGLTVPLVDEALAVRADIAAALGLPADRVAPTARLSGLMAVTAWFGSDLLALHEIQERMERRGGVLTEITPDLSVADVVRLVVAARLGADQSTRTSSEPSSQ